jgi:hypothetical protein
MLSRTENFSVVVQPESHLEHVLCAGQNVDVVAPSVSVDFARQLYVRNCIADTVAFLKLVLIDRFTVRFTSGQWLKKFNSVSVCKMKQSRNAILKRKITFIINLFCLLP